MRIELHLSQNDVLEAVREYAQNRGYRLEVPTMSSAYLYVDPESKDICAMVRAQGKDDEAPRSRP